MEGERVDGRPIRPPKTPRGAPARVLLALGRISLLVAAGGLAVIYAMQTRLIFPGSQSQGTPWATVRPPKGCELVTLTTPAGDRVVALFGPALTASGDPHPDARHRPTLLYFYGNGMCMADCQDRFELMRRLGANVLVPDYVGYGMSGGSPSEAGCAATADVAYDHLLSRPEVDRRRIVAAGWSLGGAVAIDLASRKPVAGLAVFSTFTSMAEMARRSFPFLPASILLRHRFDSLSKIARITCPTLIAHGSADRLVPASMSGRLADAAGGPVTRLTIEGADHNDFFVLGGEQIDEALGRFLEGLPPLE